MNKYFMHIKPRLSGKTSRLIDLLSEGSVLIVPAQYAAWQAIQTSGKPNIMTSQQFISHYQTLGIRYNTYNIIYIDEYLGMAPSVQRHLYEIIKQHHKGKVVIMTSAYRLINCELLRLVTQLRKPGTEKFLNSEYQAEIEYLRYNFLSDPQTQIDAPYHDLEASLTQEQFTMTLGRIFE